MRDLLVAGGGPAGLAAAVHAAQAGLEVTVLEPRQGVIDKACGEGLMPTALVELQRMGIALPTGHPFAGICYRWGDQAVSADFSAGPGLGVRRTVLHAAMRQRALELGVELREERLKQVVQHADHVDVQGHRARWLIAADGLHSPTRDLLGLGRPSSRSRRIGLRRHFAQAPWSRHVEVLWSDDTEAYITPVGPELVGVALLTRAGEQKTTEAGRPFERLLDRFPDLRDRLGQPCTQVRGAGPFVQSVAARTAGRVLLVGDAAGYLDPLTGEGICLGLKTASAAVRAILDDDPQAYERDWWRITRSYRWLTGALLWIADARWRRRLILPTLRRTPGLLRLGIQQLQ